MNKKQMIAGLAILVFIGASFLLVTLWKSGSTTEAPVPEVLLNQTTRTNGLFYRIGQDHPFNGVVVDRYSSGQLKSRTGVENGLLHGASEGWFTNGVMQVREHFTNSVSHGQRIKWHINGAKKSEEEIIAGQLEGPFLEWHDNGMLSRQITLVHGEADGTSRSWFPSGFLKARAVLDHGQVREQTFFEDGQRTEPPADGTPPKNPNDFQAPTTELALTAG